MGTVCLQGGGEFSPGCRGMDTDLVRRAAGRVVVTALAGAVGSDYATATANGVRHFLSVGASDVVGAPDAREDPGGAAEVLRTARLLVLPGGSPVRLLEALQQTPAGAAVAELLADDGVVMGASAGAMVLCPWTVLPDRRGPHGPAVEPGLDLVPDLLVLPHWSGDAGRGGWLRSIELTVPDRVQVLGIPEESGVLVHGGVLTAVGRSPSRLVGLDRDLTPGQSWEPA